MHILKIALLSAGAACVSVPASADDGGPLVTPAKEAEYTALAARVIATADACAALDIIDPGLGFLDEIELGMMSFGAGAAEVEEWESTVITTKSAAIQAILKAEDHDAAWLACTKDIDEKRKTLAAILKGDDTDDSMIDNGSTPGADTGK
jgi:hypothetical protein